MSVANKIDTLLSFLENKVGSNTNHNLPENLTNLSGFQIDEDLRQTADFMAFKGHFGDEEKPSIMTVRPSKPKPDEFKQFKNRLTLASTGRFGKGFGYYKGKCTAPKSFNVDIIYPWTEPEDPANESKEDKEQRLKDQQKVFNKFYKRNLPKRSFIVRETPKMYETITKPIIEAIPTRSIQWVYDILDEKREAERIIVKDMDTVNGFVSVPDSKWKSHPKIGDNGVPRSEWKLNKDIAKSLYVLSIVRDRTTRSLRDLRGKHVGLLENLMEKTCAAIEEVYGLKKNELRIFVHYPPQYYQFHVHFCCLAIDYGIYCAKAILLEDIIDNLKMDGSYYEKANIACTVFEGDKLLDEGNATNDGLSEPAHKKRKIDSSE